MIQTKKSKVSSGPLLIRMLLKSNLLMFLLGFMTSGSIFLLTTNSNSIGESSRLDEFTSEYKSTEPRLGVIVPFRDRFDELLVFVPHISHFLLAQNIRNFKIYAVNQIDEFRFNRGSLVNVGFLYATSNTEKCDYVVMHDVDLLPVSPLLDYSYRLEQMPYHLSAPGLHPEYNYSTFIGGVLMVSRQNFLSTNGMSARYWGWGREDDFFYIRLRQANWTIHRPDVSKFKSKEAAFWHNHRAERRPRDKKRFVKQKKESLRLDDLTGLDSVQYRVADVRQLVVDSKWSCSVINVELFCDRTDTPWCSHDYQFLD